MFDIDKCIKYMKETEDWYLDLAKDTPFEEKLNESLVILKNTIK